MLLWPNFWNDKFFGFFSGALSVIYIIRDIVWNKTESLCLAKRITMYPSKSHPKKINSIYNPCWNNKPDSTRWSVTFIFVQLIIENYFKPSEAFCITLRRNAIAAETHFIRVLAHPFWKQLFINRKFGTLQAYFVRRNSIFIVPHSLVLR